MTMTTTARSFIRRRCYSTAMVQHRRLLYPPPSRQALSASSFVLLTLCRGMVSIHGLGGSSLSPSFRLRKQLRQQQQQENNTNNPHHQPISPLVTSTSANKNDIDAPPPDPNRLLSPSELQIQVDRLIEWFDDKQNIVCLTGAGISTESGIPDYRGHDGSYHRGHKPIVHDQFVSSEQSRQRYWARGMIGWKTFDSTQPNAGHDALTQLERIGKIGVTFPDRAEYYPDGDNDLEWMFADSQEGRMRQVSIITQNVDGLHARSGTKHVVELHGRTNILKCMSCGHERDRNTFHTELERLNEQWYEQTKQEITQQQQQEERQRNENNNFKQKLLRPDGDANVQQETYDHIQVPSCQSCMDGFYKPDVVFFGDSVPKSRVELCRSAIHHADGVLVVGSSLAVYSAYRHVRAALRQYHIPVAILNVGLTRPEVEGLGVRKGTGTDLITKIEAPIGRTLDEVAKYFASTAAAHEASSSSPTPSTRKHREEEGSEGIATG